MEKSREKKIKRIMRLKKMHARNSKRKKMKSEGKHVTIKTPAGDVDSLWYGFGNPEIKPLFIGLHGGGFVMGDPIMDEQMNLRFMREADCKVISIDYPKAPENPYPKAIEQLDALVAHLAGGANIYKIDPDRIAIGGHSAGGNLSAVMCLKAKTHDKYNFVCQVLDYPPLDLATSPYDKPNPKGSIPPKIAEMFDTCYFEPGQGRDKYISPVYAQPEDITGLPPAMFILAGRDSLHDEGLRYYEMLKDAGVECELHDYPDSAHGFTLKDTADARDAIDKMGKFLKKHLQG
jgi:acetyl esterase